jgi:hypothetical protein
MESAETTRRQVEWLFPEHEVSQAAQRASELLGRAAESEQQAAGSLENSEAGPAGPPQAEAAAALGEAAGALSETAEAFASAARDMPLPDLQMPGAEAARELSSGYEAASRASSSRSTADAAVAAGHLQRASSSMEARLRSMGLQPFSARRAALRRAGYESLVGDPQAGPGSSSGREAADRLQEAGISLSDWARLPGELRNEILQAAGEKSPAEYRELIKRYFSEIARRGKRTEDGEEE